MKEPITLDDKELMKKLYNLSPKEIVTAEMLYHRSSMSILAAAKAVMNKHT